jgi:uncharacterized protein YbaP (TraB family)
MRFAPLALAFALAAAPTAASAAPAIWEVSDADSKVWLFGSVHVLPKEMTWRTPKLDELIRQSEQIYFEADIGPLGQLAVIINGIKIGFGEKVDWVAGLTPEQKDKLTAAVTPLGLTIDQLGTFQPWLADAMIQETVIEHLGYTPSAGVDATLQAELPKERKAYFETVASQLALLAADPVDVQLKRLMITVDTVPTLGEEMTDMANAWSTGDVDALAKEIADDPTMDESFTKSLVTNRNADWLTTIVGLLKDNHNDLIVVGAGHLAGDGSVVDLLAKAGFTVQRIQ